MGQYYKPVNATTKECLVSHDYDNGLKLMEHSWIGNKFVRTVESLLAAGGDWEGEPLVWCGDYADCAEDHYNVATKVQPPVSDHSYRYLVNVTKNQFVDKARGIAGEWGKIHPLPLLTSQGNGQGGGDFWGDEKDLVGAWAFDVILPCDELPDIMELTEINFDLVED